MQANGWDGLGEELNRRSKRGEWEEMGRRISDEMLNEFAIVAEPDHVAERLLTRYGDVFTRKGFSGPYPVPEGFWDRIVQRLKAS
jgi:alkanesulfonate monooxygenase SsuD/methylene tetrahydromethanopterin reductase-like flavin-dependent oxidoreductase (luciferase family)